MKIEQLLVQHFYNSREITLQGMGTFKLSPDFIAPMDNDKDMVMPENAVSFQYNPKCTEDDALINFIVQQTRKIKPLASADLDSYLVLGKQFLNIGKPFKIEGIGILEKNMQGEYEFKQGHYASAKMEAAPVVLKEKSEEDISFAATKHKSGGGGKKALLVTACILLLGLIGWGAWYYLNRKKGTEKATAQTEAQTTPPATPDSGHTEKQKPDSPGNMPVPVSNPDNYTFRVVFRETIDEAAAKEKMAERIKNKHFVIIYTTDSVLFKLAEPFKLPLSDTARIRDSLNKCYYNGKAHVEIY